MCNQTILLFKLSEYPHRTLPKLHRNNVVVNILETTRKSECVHVCIITFICKNCLKCAANAYKNCIFPLICMLHAHMVIAYKWLHFIVLFTFFSYVQPCNCCCFIHCSIFSSLNSVLTAVSRCYFWAVLSAHIHRWTYRNINDMILKPCGQNNSR